MLRLTVTMVDEPAVAGSSLRVRAALRNDGREAVDLTASPVLSLAFRVRDPAGQTVASCTRADAGSRWANQLGGAPPAIPAGGQVTYEDDLAGCLGAPLSPGRYDVVAELQRDAVALAATTASITVHALVPDAVVRVAGAEGAWLGTLVAHRQADRGHTLLYSFDRAPAPPGAPLRAVLELAPDPASPSIALAPRALGEPSIAWVAGSARQRLQAVLARIVEVPGSGQPAVVGLEPGAPGLLPTGSALPDGGALFLDIARDGVSLSVVRIGSHGETVRSAVRLTPPLTDVHRAVAFSVVGEAVRAYLCWVGADEHTLHLLAFDPARPDPQPSSSLFHHAAGRIAALQVDPPDPNSPPYVHVLEVAGEPETPAVLTRLHPVTGLLVDRAQIAAPPVMAQPVRRWLLPSSGVSARGPVVVVSDGAAWLLTGDGWSDTGLRIADPLSAELVRYGDQWWLSSWSPAAGTALRPVASKADGAPVPSR